MKFSSSDEIGKEDQVRFCEKREVTQEIKQRGLKGLRNKRQETIGTLDIARDNENGNEHEDY